MQFIDSIVRGRFASLGVWDFLKFKMTFKQFSATHDEFSKARASLQEEMDRIDKEEKELMLQMEGFLSQKEHLNSKMKNLSLMLPTLRDIHKEASCLVSTINDISESSECISNKIRSLDYARTNVDDCQNRISDLIDLDLCSRGVERAILDEDYETGAGHIHRFLSIDQNLLKNSASEIENISGVLKSVRTLQDARTQLCDIVRHKFNQAVKSNESVNMERFFKIYPLLGMHDEGIRDFCGSLCRKLEVTAQKNLQTAIQTPLIDKRHNILFADTITLLFEGVARVIDTQQPVIETYYGPGRLLSVVQILQQECDRQAKKIVMEFVKHRQLTKILSMVADANRMTPSGSTGKLERLDPKDLDLLIGELTVMHARIELYISFLYKKILNDIDSVVSNDAERRVKIVEIDKMVNNSQLSQCKHELLGHYLQLDQYFMEESISKAVAMDSVDTGDGQTSSMVDDTFFIIKKSIRRAISTGSLDGTCALINTGCRVLESDFCAVLKARLRSGYPAGYMDLTQQAYNVLHTSIQQGRLPAANTVVVGADAEQTRVAFVVALNNADESMEYVDQLCDSILVEIEQAMPRLKENERGKLESCLSGLSAVSTNLKEVIEYGMQQLRASAVKPRVNPWVDAFMNISHHLTEDELSAYEAGTSFVQTLMMHLDSLLLSFKDILTDANYDAFVAMVTAEVTQRLEKVILKSTYNRLGGLILDKEMRTLAGYLTTSTSWTVRDKFARLTQIATILNLEKVQEISDYWGNHEGALTWRLTPADVRQVLSLRTDFKVDDIRRLKL